jgi:hypothetical protein
MFVHRPIKFIILFLLLGQAALADVRLELSRNTISMDETVTLNLISETRGMFRPPEIPLPDGLEVRGTSQQSIIIDGQAEFTLAYTIAPTKPGTYQIGPYRLQNGQELPAQTLTVTPAAVVRATDALFATLEASSEETLIRQTVELTLSFFSEEPIGDIELLNFPEEGFELGDWQEIRAGTRIINGTRYRQKRYVARLTPTQPGTLTFDPTFRVEVQEPGSSRSLLFGTMRVRVERIGLQEPLTLTVAAPPEKNRPEGYAGHIGRFQLSADISPQSVNAGDPVTLRVTLEGSGSLKQALPPHLEDTEDLNVYSPRIVTEDLSRDGLNGRKVLEQVVIPTSSAVTELPELAFHYYDPEAQRYVTLTEGPFPLTVTGDSAGALSAESLTLESMPLATEALGEDLVYLKLNPGRLVSLSSLTPGVGFATGAGLPFLLWALSTVWMKQQKTRQGDPNRQRRDQAPQRLRKHLAELDSAEDLWDGIWETLSGYLRDRFTLPAGEMDRDDILNVLPDSVSESTRNQMTEWIKACEQARFSGSSSIAPMEESSDFSTEGRGTPDEFRTFMIRLDREIGK